MRIIVDGASGGGKSTLVNVLQKVLGFGVVQSPSRAILTKHGLNAGFKNMTDSDVFGIQSEILHMASTDWHNHKNSDFIFDRSLVSVAAFSMLELSRRDFFCARLAGEAVQQAKSMLATCVDRPARFILVEPVDPRILPEQRGLAKREADYTVQMLLHYAMLGLLADSGVKFMVTSYRDPAEAAVRSIDWLGLGDPRTPGQVRDAIAELDAAQPESTEQIDDRLQATADENARGEEKASVLAEAVEEVNAMNDLMSIPVRVHLWRQRNFPNATAEMQLLGIMEEVGELAHAQLKGMQGIRHTPEEIRKMKEDAVADIAVYAMAYSGIEGIDYHAGLRRTWAKVEKRDWQKDPMNAASGELT